MPSPYISPATLDNLKRLDAEASPPPLYQETAYVMTDQGIERRFMAVVRTWSWRCSYDSTFGR